MAVAVAVTGSVCSADRDFGGDHDGDSNGDGESGHDRDHDQDGSSGSGDVHGFGQHIINSDFQG